MTGSMTGMIEGSGSREELDRRTECFNQARRIRAYLPVLKARAEALERELAELYELIADEEITASGLEWEGSHTTYEVKVRREKRKAKAAA